MTSDLILKFMLTAAITLAITSPGVALSCWVCRSDSEPRCADPFDNSTLLFADCASLLMPGASSARYCSKMTSTVNGRTVYFRSCSDHEGTCPNVEFPGVCSTCQRSLCNGASFHSAPASLLAATTTTITIAIALFRWF